MKTKLVTKPPYNFIIHTYMISPNAIDSLEEKKTHKFALIITADVFCHIVTVLTSSQAKQRGFTKPLTFKISKQNPYPNLHFLR